MMRRVYKNANGGEFDFITENGKFVFVGKTDEDGIDLKGKKVYPGLVDIHSHGCVGYDTMDGENLEEMSLFLAENGTTSWLPTTMTMPMETIKKVTKNKDINNKKAAQILGFHMEGPYISPEFKGAQNEKFIKSPDINEFEELENIKIVTVAPELEGSMEFIKKCKAVVSLGHTSADYETSASAMEAGAECLTHTFNAMPPLNHRNPGPVGAAIDKNIYVQVICDGIHIHKSVIKALYKIFGSERMILISDSMRATGMPDGEYEFGGQKITVKNKVARTEVGAIAGSTSTLFECVKKAVEFGIPETEAFKMASRTPAELIGVKKGRLEPGFDADFIVIDEKMNLSDVVINGEKVL